MRATRSIALLGTAITALCLGLGTATADPSSPPPAQSIVAVGAETQSGLFDQFSTDYDTTDPSYPLYNWNTTGTTPIETKNNAACEDIPRPISADYSQTDFLGPNSLFAVSASPSFTVGGTTYKCMDIAPSAQPLDFGEPTNLAQDVIAEDLNTYSYLPTGNIPPNLTKIDLEAIFSCNASLISSNYTGAVTENEIGGKGSDEVMPVISSTFDETRNTWMGDLGLSNTAIASCVTNASYTYDGTAYPIPENEGTNPVFNPSDNPDAADVIFPYSAGDYVCYNDTKACQATQFGTEFDSGGLVLGDIAGTAPLTGTTPSQTINTASFDPVFDSGLYVDFISSGTGSDIPTYLQNLLGTGTRGSGWLCATGGIGQSDINEYGFANIKNCGLITITPTS